MKKKTEIIILSLILALGFLVRLYRFNGPIADWHSWRQSDTSAVSWFFVHHGYDILHPKYFDLSNVQSGQDNPQGYRFVEFPVYNVLQAGFSQILPVFTLEEWGRLLTILASLSTVYLLYLILKRHGNSLLGLLGAFFFAFIPYNIYYGRTILPDPSMAASILAATYFFDLWIEKFEVRSSKSETNSKSKRYKSEIKWKKANGEWQMLALATSFTALAFLLKPYAAFFTLPMIYLVFKRFGFGFLKRWELYVFGVISLVPILLWREWISQFPEGVPSYLWLFNGNHIRFHPSFFRWVFYERLTKLILGFGGIILFAFGLVRIKIFKDWIFLLSFILSSLLYVCVVATGNVQHDYYQILIMPSVSIICAIGSYVLLQNSKDLLDFSFGKVIFVVCVVVMLTLGWHQVKDYFNINNPAIVLAGEEADKILPKDAKVIAPYEGDTSFLYQTKRQGWPSFEKDPGELKKMGAEYLILPNPTPNDFKGFGRQYQIIASSKDYLILKL